MDCRAQTKRGAACRSFALPDSTFCLSHDPERLVVVQEARARGGAAASKLRALEGRRAKLDTPTALVRFTGRLIQTSSSLNLGEAWKLFPVALLEKAG